MTHSPLGNLHRIASLSGHSRAAATWLAFLALLGNILLPAALSIVVPKEPGRDTPRVGLCGQSPGDAPSKIKPGLLVQHCPLCAISVAPPPSPPGFVVPGELVDESKLQLLTTISVPSIRHGRMQARAPPSVV
jgi:hypothetical protein